jgi:Lon protease-like protein
MLSRYVDDEAPYLVAIVEPFEDRDDAPVSANTLAELTAEFQRYDTARRALHDIEPDREPLPTEAALLSFRVAGGMELDLVEQQRLLELRSTPARVERLLELLPALRREMEAGAAVHRRAGQNGKGHMHPGLTEEK